MPQTTGRNLRTGRDMTKRPVRSGLGPDECHRWHHALSGTVHGLQSCRPMSVPNGARLGPYEILSLIGAGGMGEVYSARDTRLDRSVAIKVLPTRLADSEGRQRFEREARVVSTLNHPNICSLYDVGCQDGIDFLVMEYLEGETLAARLAKGPLPEDQLVQYALQIVRALAQAHRHGVLHRDLKPGNVMITRGGVKLLDFGLAKLFQPQAYDSAASEAPTLSQDLTAKGTILGTLHYMAPEQLEGKPTDARSDIFSFGAVLSRWRRVEKLSPVRVPPA